MNSLPLIVFKHAYSFKWRKEMLLTEIISRTREIISLGCPPLTPEAWRAACEGEQSQMEIKRTIGGGGSGFIGRHLVRLLRDNGLKTVVVSRTPGPGKITWESLSGDGLPDGCTAVVSMAGQQFLDPLKRWTEEFKQSVWNSRVKTTTALAKAVSEADTPPEVFVSMSGVAFYPPHPMMEYTEEHTEGGNYDFLSRLTVAWENAAIVQPEKNVRQVTVRSGVVLGRESGMIQQIYLPFFLGLGGRIGSGQQWFPWIHVQDIAGIFTYAILNQHVTGILNGVAPQAATNSDFTKTFASELWRPALFPIPGFCFNWIYGNERAKVILEGQKVIPKRTEELGYKFVYPDLSSACKECSKLFSGQN